MYKDETTEGQAVDFCEWVIERNRRAVMSDQKHVMWGKHAFGPDQLTKQKWDWLNLLVAEYLQEVHRVYATPRS